MNNNLVLGGSVSVSVAGQTFNVPAEKVNELVQYLSSIQSVRVEQNHISPPITYRGQSLING